MKNKSVFKKGAEKSIRNIFHNNTIDVLQNEIPPYP